MVGKLINMPTHPVDSEKTENSSKKHVGFFANIRNSDFVVWYLDDWKGNTFFILVVALSTCFISLIWKFFIIPSIRR